MDYPYQDQQGTLGMPGPQPGTLGPRGGPPVQSPPMGPPQGQFGQPGTLGAPGPMPGMQPGWPGAAGPQPPAQPGWPGQPGGFPGSQPGGGFPQAPQGGFPGQQRPSPIPPSPRPPMGQPGMGGPQAGGTGLNFGKRVSVQVYTPECTLSFPNLFQPRAPKGGGKPKYSAAFLFDPGTDLTGMWNAVIQAATEQWGPQAAEALRYQRLKHPFRDGAAKGYAPGIIYMNCRSDFPPGLVGRQKDANGRAAPLSDPKFFYPGCRVRADLNAFCFDNQGNRGVSFGLNNIQWMGDGPRLDNRRSAQDAFEGFDDPAADFGGGGQWGAPPQQQWGAPPPPQWQGQAQGPYPQQPAQQQWPQQPAQQWGPPQGGAMGGGQIPF